ERSGGRGGKVTWKNPEECQAYVDRLQDAAEKLSSENRRFRHIHAQIGRDVTELMNIDLLRNRDKWRSHWNSLQQFVSEMTRPYEQPRLYNWLLFWDHQLYKALEVSTSVQWLLVASNSRVAGPQINYKMGLESLNENLNEIKCELIFSNRQLQFRPPIEELRLGYYKEMKHFIATPANFPGFQSQAVFQRMAEKNVALGKVDLEKFVATHVTTVADYEVNFKMLKAKRKESEKLPDFYKIDCVTVSATPFRAAVEDHMQRLSDTLVFSLRST
ncbi:DYH1B, partial [Symbiodinium sp. KB8]